MEVQRTVSSYQDKENIYCNTVMPSSVIPEKHQACNLGEITNVTPFSSEVSLEQDHMKKSPVKYFLGLKELKLKY